MTIATENNENVDKTGEEDGNTEVVENQVLEQDNPLGLSDEDFLKQGAPGAKVEVKTEEVADATKTGVKADEKTGAEADAAAGGTPGAKAGDGTEEKNKEKPAVAADTEAKPGEKTGTEAKSDEVKDDKAQTAPKTGEIDYTAAGKELLAPFKANGREVRVDSVEDARALMQMGANYNKKMAALKPSLKVLKLLENNDLLSEEKLGFLIDLSKKDPKAINKLVKESGINPMEIDPEKAGEYRPTAQKVDDREVELDTVLDDIKESGSYTKTLAIAKGWDAASKTTIGDNPVLLKVINDHVERGIYDLINTEVERERTYGRLQGLSDIEAYRQVGDAIQARGGFNHLAKPDATASASQGKTSEAGKVVEPKPKQGDDESRNQQRRALGTPKTSAPSGSTPKDYNPLALSDEDFLKQATPKFR